MKTRNNSQEDWLEHGEIYKIASFLPPSGGLILYTRGGKQVFLAQEDLDAMAQRTPARP